MSTTSNGPLEGLRVVELTDATGRFAGKVLAESGASVARIGRLTPGPAMRDTDLGHRGGVLDWWLDGGTRWIDADIATTDGQGVYRRLAERADLVIETQPPGRLGDFGVDHADVSTSNPALVQVSLTPFGRTGPRAEWQTSDLVAGGAERRPEHLGHARSGHRGVGAAEPDVRLVDGVHLRTRRRQRGTRDRGRAASSTCRCTR